MARKSSSSADGLIAQVNSIAASEQAPSIDTQRQMRRPAKKLSEQFAESAAAKAEERASDEPTDLAGVDVDAEFAGGILPEDIAPLPEAAAEPIEQATDPNQWPDYLMKSALDYGLDHRDYADPKALGKAILREASRAPAQQFNPQFAPQPQPSPAPFDPFEGKEEEYDEQTRKVVKNLAGQLQQFQGQLAQSQQLNQQLMGLEGQRRERAIDDAFIKLNEKFGGAFGDKPLSATPRNSSEFLARQQAVTAAIALSQTTGRPVEDLLEGAAGVIFGSTPQEAARNVRAQQITSKLERRNGQMLGAPSHREPAVVSPEKEGIEYIRRFVNGNRQAAN